MKIAFVCHHRPDFFFTPVVKALMERGHQVALTSQVPLDAANMDVVVVAYINENLRNISQSLVSVPMVAIGMGTDIVVNAGAGVFWPAIHTVFAFNQEHADILRKTSGGEANVKLVDWFLNDAKLMFKQRPAPERSSDGKLQGLRLVNTALHQYSKGLDNLVQQLADLGDIIDLDSLELHVVGSVGPFNDYNQYLNFYVQWLTQEVVQGRTRAGFRAFYHGEQHPAAVDSLIESINPHAYISASQGEQGATSVMEGLYKGLPVFLQDHPFREAVYPNHTPGIYPYHTAGGLREQIVKAFSQPVDSQKIHEAAKARFTLSRFVDDLEQVLIAAADSVKVRTK